MSVLTTIPKFLYPYSRQFPFDEVAEKIVREMEKRNWEVPGINIEFDVYGSGEAKYRMVRNITGDNFSLYFCRKQDHLDGNLINTVALSEVCIPKQIIEVYDDESGPIYYLYVGKDWKADKAWFMNSIKVNSKLNKKSRRYLRYKGNAYKQRAKELIADDDLGREYSPEGDEPVRFNLEQKLEEFAKWLEEFVLEYVLSFPEGEQVQGILMPELIPYVGPWTTVFSICDGRDASRIKIGRRDKNSLPPEERHAYIGSGWRLVPLSVQSNGRFPEIAYKGFIWCDVNQSITKCSKKNDISYGVSSVMSTLWPNKQYIVAIKLKYSNDVYVADNAKFEKTRQQLFKDIAPRDRLTDEELGEAETARGATIVPITEYKGDYEEPIVLINRELDFDEIEWIVEKKK